MLGKTQVQQDKYGSVIKHTHSQFHAHRCYVWFYSPSVENSFVQGRFIWLDEAFSQEKETTIANMILSNNMIITIQWLGTTSNIWVLSIERGLSNDIALSKEWVLSNDRLLSYDWVLRVYPTAAYYPSTWYYQTTGNYPTTVY